MLRIPTETLPEGQLELKELVFIQGSTLKANTPVVKLYFEPLASLMEAVIMCESSGNQEAIGKAGEIGIAQFKKETWNWMTKLAGYNGDIDNESDQRFMLYWGLENNYEKHWSCYSKVVN